MTTEGMELKEVKMTSQKKETIVAVALKRGKNVFTLPKPARHGDCIYHNTVMEKWGGKICPDEQGFLTNTGKYVSREEAVKIALKAGQVTYEKLVVKDRLFSEDLW